MELPRNADSALCSAQSNSKPLELSNEEEDKKQKEIEQICSKRDIEQLRLIASTPGGLIIDRLRKKACKYQTKYILKTLT
jgi:hypothetical protein